MLDVNPVRNSVASSPNNRLSIFHMNDLHGQTDDLHALYMASRNFDAKKSASVDTLKLSGGDNISGGDAKKNTMIAGFLNAIGLDASAVGNHEFDAGANNLGNLVENSKCVFVSENLEIPDSNPLREKIHGSTIKEINGTKYGIIGLTTPDLAKVTKSDEIRGGIEVEDLDETIEETQEEIDELRAQGVNRIVLLSHCGFEFDKNLAQKTNGIDVIISGHSHDTVEGAVEGENLLRSSSGEPVLIVQAGENGNYYGICDIDFNENGIMERVSHSLNKTTPQKNMLVENAKNFAIGPSPTIASVAEVDPFPKNKRNSPCAWSNLITDSMRSELDADIAVINSGNVRKVPTAGILTERDVFDTTPMKNKLIKTIITERELAEAIKFASEHTMNEASGEPGLLQVSGLDYTIDTQGNLLDLNFTDKNGQKRKIDIQNPSDTATFSIILDDFCINGKEYPQLKLTNREMTNYDFDKDKTAVDYIKKITQGGKVPLSIKDDHRLRIAQTSIPQQPSNNTQNFLELTSPKSA